jgi:hypothetical protein
MAVKHRMKKYLINTTPNRAAFFLVTTKPLLLGDFSPE